jgi:hypothetical protein
VSAVSNLTAEQQGQISVPRSAWNMSCPACDSGNLAPVLASLDADENEGLGFVTVECDRQCGYQGATYRWELTDDEYRNVFGDDEDESEHDDEPEEDDGCYCDDPNCANFHPEGRPPAYERWVKGDKRETLECDDLEGMVGDIADDVAGRWSASTPPLRRGEMIVRDRRDGRKWDAIDFLLENRDLADRYLELGSHALWPETFPTPGLDYTPNRNWANEV